MHIGKNNPKLEYTMRTENENKILIETREEKDLGVWITNDLKPEKQVIAASQRAMTVLRSVKRAFVRFDIETFSIIYTTYKTAFGILYPSLGTILCKRYIIIGESPKKSHQTGVGTKRFIVWRKIRKIKIIQPRRTEITWWFNTDFQIINWERKCRLWNLI